MTLAQLSDTLPNGFHDAELNDIKIDFVNATALILMNLNVTADIDSTGGRSRYQAAEILVSGLRSIIVGGWVKKLELLSGPLEVSGYAVTKAEGLPPSVAEAVPHGKLYSFFVDDWNTSIYILADRAEIRWGLEEA